MSRNGSGTYNLPAGNPVVTGTTITSNWANTTLTDIATALTGSLAADGQTPVTGNIAMGNNKITGLGTPTSSQDAVTKAYVDSNLPVGLESMAYQQSNNVSITGGTIATTTLSNNTITGGTISSLASALPIASGGTGLTSAGTSGYVLTSNGSAWVSSALPANVSSATAGNGISVSASTGAVTIAYQLSKRFNDTPKWFEFMANLETDSRKCNVSLYCL